MSGVELLFGDAPFFKEFALRLPRPAEEVRDALIERGFLAGVPLPDAEGHALLVAVTERRTREQIDGLSMALKEVLARARSPRATSSPPHRASAHPFGSRGRGSDTGR